MVTSIEENRSASMFMVGLIQFLLLDMVKKSAGEDVARDILERAGVGPDRTYKIDEAYDDDEFQRILNSACERLGISRRDAERAFAAHFMKDAVKRWPMWFKISRNSRELLRRQPAIHNGFASGLANESDRNKVRDKFQFEDRDEELVVYYKSPNDLCGVFADLANEIAGHYGESLTIDEPKCLRRGDDACEIHVHWN